MLPAPCSLLPVGLEVGHDSLEENWGNSSLGSAPTLATLVAFPENPSVHTWPTVVLQAQAIQDSAGLRIADHPCPACALKS